MKCGKCQLENPIGMHFRGRCGMSLHDKHPGFESRPEPTVIHSIPEPERKNVTALLTNLSGYMVMTEKLDTKQVKESTGEIFTGDKQIVVNCYSLIEKVMGKGSLVFFGVSLSQYEVKGLVLNFEAYNLCH